MPTRIILHGNEELANRYRFIAYHLLLPDTLKLMSFQGLAIYRRRVVLEHGIEVVIRVHHGNSMIHITAPFVPGKAPEVPRPEELYVAVCLGDELVGYHFFLWDVLGKSQVGGIRTAATFDEIEGQYPFLQQEDCFLLKRTVGSAEKDFPGFDLTCSPSPCSVYEHNTYTHPISDEDVDDYEHYQADTVVGDYGDTWEVELWQWRIYFYRSFYPYFMASNIIEKCVPNHAGQEDYLQVEINRFYQAQLNLDEGIPWYDESRSITFDSPLGLMECLQGDNHPTYMATDSDYSYVWGAQPDNTDRCQTGSMMLPFTYDRREDSAPDYLNSDFRVRRTFANAFNLDVPGMVQVYTVSFKEYQGQFRWEYCDCIEDDRQHLVFVAAACSAGLGDPSTQERNTEFEQAIKDLILAAHDGQETAGHIIDEDSYRGNIRTYFTKPDLDPGKVDGLHERKKAMLKLVNEARANNGAGPLRLNPDLELAAKRHAKDSAKNQLSGHTGSDGSSTQDRIEDCGYAVNGVMAGTQFGENAAQNNGGSIQDVFDGWKNSSGHWATLTDSNYQETGFGIGYDTDGVEYWVETFGHNPNNQ